MNAIQRLENELAEDLIPKTLETKYRKGDFLIIDGLRFSMSHYSLAAIGPDKQQSQFVEYVGNGLTIALDFLKDTIEIF